MAHCPLLGPLLDPLLAPLPDKGPTSKARPEATSTFNDKHKRQIPPSIAIARYLHDYPQAKTLNLIGPLFAEQPADKASPKKLKTVGKIQPQITLPDEPLIFVDGGTQYRTKTALKPAGFAVGDGDSYSGQLDEQLNPDKDYSDLAYVLASIPAHFTDVNLLGFLGARRDHEWINLGEGFAFLSQRSSATHLHFDDIATGLTAGQWQLDIHRPFSLIAIKPAQITLTGECRYTLKTATTLEPLSSHGLSNAGHGRIELETDQALFVVYA